MNRTASSIYPLFCVYDGLPLLSYILGDPRWQKEMMCVCVHVHVCMCKIAREQPLRMRVWVLVCGVRVWDVSTENVYIGPRQNQVFA